MSLSLVNKFLFFRAIEIECRCFFFRQRAQYWDQDSNMANVFQVSHILSTYFTSFYAN